jgi:hypothetical protein
MYNDKELLDLGKISIESMAPYIKKYLGPLPKYKIKFRVKQKYGRSDVPFNVEGLGLFVFFREGIRQRLFEPLQKHETRVYSVGSWINGIVHDLTHLYQEVSLQKIYKSEEKRTGCFRRYWYWLDGFAEYLTWEVSSNLYKEARSEEDYWAKRDSLKDAQEAIELKRYKLGIKERIVQLATWYYFLLKNKSLEKYFELPEFLPQDIKDEVILSIKKKRLFFEISSFAKERFNSILKGEEETTNLWFPYAIGFICVSRIMRNGGSYLELLNNPRSNGQLLKLAGVSTK